FAIWLTVGSSCAVKAEVMNLLAGSTPVTQSVKNGVKSGEIKLAQTENESCSQTQKTLTDKFSLQNLGNHFESFPDLFLAVTGLFLFHFLSLSLRQRSIPLNDPASLKDRSDLFLRFQRLQFYT